MNIEIKGEKNLQKYNMRKQARFQRQNLVNGFVDDARLVSSFLINFRALEGVKVAGYWPVNGEADVKPLLLHCNEQSCVCLLPVVVGDNVALIFRKWQPEDELNLSSLGVHEPSEDKPTGVPDILLVPVLAFDNCGNRLGYGGGYYDRTLIDLRTQAAIKDKKVTAIGVAYAGQEVDEVPSGRFDQRLDWIITENGARPFQAGLNINKAV